MSGIYEPKGRAREYSPLALNYFKGCEHGCSYCYVKPMMKRFNSNYQHESAILSVNFEEIERSAKKMQGCGKQILFSFTTDPYTQSENGETRKVLEILNKYEHKVAILSKSGSKLLRDIDIFHAYGNRIKVGQSLTFDNNEDSLLWESGAALPEDRLFSIEYLAYEGIKTWASFEPTIIPEQSINLLSKVVNYIDHVKIGKINNYKGLDKSIDWAMYANQAVLLLRENGMDKRFYIKEDLRAFCTSDLYPEERDPDFLSL